MSFINIVLLIYYEHSKNKSKNYCLKNISIVFPASNSSCLMFMLDIRLYKKQDKYYEPSSTIITEITIRTNIMTL